MALITYHQTLITFIPFFPGMNIILGADYADYTDYWLRYYTILQKKNPFNPRNPRLKLYSYRYSNE